MGIVNGNHFNQRRSSVYKRLCNWKYKVLLLTLSLWLLPDWVGSRVGQFESPARRGGWVSGTIWSPKAVRGEWCRRMFTWIWYAGKMGAGREYSEENCVGHLFGETAWIDDRCHRGGCWQKVLCHRVHRQLPPLWTLIHNLVAVEWLKQLFQGISHFFCRSGQKTRQVTPWP